MNTINKVNLRTQKTLSSNNKINFGQRPQTKAIEKGLSEIPSIKGQQIIAKGLGCVAKILQATQTATQEAQTTATKLTEKAKNINPREVQEILAKKLKLSVVIKDAFSKSEFVKGVKVSEEFYTLKGRLDCALKYDPTTRNCVKYTQYQTDGETPDIEQEYDAETKHLTRHREYNSNGDITADYKYHPKTGKPLRLVQNHEDGTPDIVNEFDDETGKLITLIRYKQDGTVELSENYDRITGKLTHKNGKSVLEQVSK